MRNILIHCGAIVVLIYALAACSHQNEYPAAANSYLVAATQVPSTGIHNNSNIKNLTSGKNTGDDVSLFDAPLSAPAIAISKKDSKTLGSIYIPNAFSSNQDTMMFELKRENRSYKAVTPFLFDSPQFNSHLAFSVNGHRAATAGLEFRIPLGLKK